MNSDRTFVFEVCGNLAKKAVKYMGFMGTGSEESKLRYLLKLGLRQYEFDTDWPENGGSSYRIRKYTGKE